MDVSIEPELVIEGGEPAVRQIEAQLRQQILDGILRAGEELPTVRSLSVGLALNPNTVEEAYGALEREGFLNRAEGCGPRVVALAFVAEHGELDNRCHEFLCRVTADGYSLAEVLQALHVCMDRGISHGESR